MRQAHDGQSTDVPDRISIQGILNSAYGDEDTGWTGVNRVQGTAEYCRARSRAVEREELQRVVQQFWARIFINWCNLCRR